MSAKNLNHRMGDEHEAFVAKALGARRARGSGSQWRDPADGRMDRRKDIIAFAFDCKSTRKASTSVSLETLAKLVEQAHGDRPLLPLRFYKDDRLRDFEDWAVIRFDDLQELLTLVQVLCDDDAVSYVARGETRGLVVPYCAMHDMMPMTDDEAAQHDAGGDPCIPALRVWSDE